MENLTDNAMRQSLRLPHTEKDQRIGLFGGSFNPPHSGHLLVSEIALRRLQLDQIWWIVTPRNPLKGDVPPMPLARRIGLCQKLTNRPDIKITAFEKNHPSRYSADTLSWLLNIRPGIHFVWVMGADNLAGFHKWQRWRQIADMLPIAVIDRPGSTLSSRSSMAARALWRYRIDEGDAPLLPSMKPPAWVFIHGPRSPMSSSAIRHSN